MVVSPKGVERKKKKKTVSFGNLQIIILKMHIHNSHNMHKIYISIPLMPNKDRK